MVRPTQMMNPGVHDDSYFSRFGLSHFSLYKTLYHFILDMSALIILSGPRCFHVPFDSVFDSLSFRAAACFMYYYGLS